MPAQNIFCTSEDPHTNFRNERAVDLYSTLKSFLNKKRTTKTDSI